MQRETQNTAVIDQAARKDARLGQATEPLNGPVELNLEQLKSVSGGAGHSTDAPKSGW
jgi:hypothetical protein